MFFSAVQHACFFCSFASIVSLIFCRAVCMALFVGLCPIQVFSFLVKSLLTCANRPLHCKNRIGNDPSSFHFVSERCIDFASNVLALFNAGVDVPGTVRSGAQHGKSLTLRLIRYALPPHHGQCFARVSKKCWVSPGCLLDVSLVTPADSRWLQMIPDDIIII